MSVTELEYEVSKLRKELAEARLEKEILKKNYGVPCQEAAARYTLIEELRSRHRYKIGVICQTFDLFRSGYYAWKRRKPSARKQEDERIVVAIKTAHERGRNIYGPDKMQTELL